MSLKKYARRWLRDNDQAMEPGKTGIRVIPNPAHPDKLKITVYYLRAISDGRIIEKYDDGMGRPDDSGRAAPGNYRQDLIRAITKEVPIPGDAYDDVASAFFMDARPNAPFHRVGNITVPVYSESMDSTIEAFAEFRTSMRRRSRDQAIANAREIQKQIALGANAAGVARAADGNIGEAAAVAEAPVPAPRAQRVRKPKAESPSV